MSESLFPEEQSLVPIPMRDAEVLLLRTLALGDPPDAVLARLIDETPWRSETIRMWDKTYVQPRLIAWYGDDGASYEYSGKRYEALPWTPLLLDLRERVETVAAVRFNSVLVNYYRDHRDSVAMHSDDERELGREPVIASLSLGETRTLVFRHKTDRSQKTKRLPLESGSLLIMRGATQRCWQHAVPKETISCGSRVNLTFRQILTGSRRTRGSA